MKYDGHHHCVVGYFADGLCRYQQMGKWTPPFQQWWWGKWQLVCVKPVGAPVGVWEHDLLATDEYKKYLAKEIAGDRDVHV